MNVQFIFRWKSTPEGTKILDAETGLPTLQFIAIRRKDCGKWAIPGVRVLFLKFLFKAQIYYFLKYVRSV